MDTFGTNTIIHSYLSWHFKNCVCHCIHFIPFALKNFSLAEENTVVCVIQCICANTFVSVTLGFRSMRQRNAKRLMFSRSYKSDGFINVLSTFITICICTLSSWRFGGKCVYAIESNTKHTLTQIYNLSTTLRTCGRCRVGAKCAMLKGGWCGNQTCKY